MLLNYIKLAWQGLNKFRKRRRKLTITLVCAFFLLFVSFTFFSSFFVNHQRYWGDLLFGSGVIVSQDSTDYEVIVPADPESYFPLSAVEEMLVKEGIDYSPRLRAGALLQNLGEEEEVMYNLWGVDVNSELKITPGVYIKEGRYPATGAAEVALFAAGAEKLKVKIGDEVIIYINTVEGYPNYTLATVSGILDYKEEHFLYDQVFAYAPLDFVQGLKGIEDGRVSDVSFRAVSIWKKIVMQWNLPKGFRILELRESIGVLDMIQTILSFCKWMVLGMVIAVIVSVMYHNLNQMLNERQKEIGVYISYGARKGKVVGVLLLELTLYLLYCSLLGLLLSVLFILVINGLNLKDTEEISVLVVGGAVLRMYFSINSFVQTFGLLWLFASLAAIKPLWMGIKERRIIDLLTR
jgi:ABC-type lipoprotein release transport system permease subunit